jgi:zinc D-Ala-D-Ala carboxypeptidase
MRFVAPPVAKSRSPRWLRSLSFSVITAAIIVWSGVAVQFFWPDLVNSAPPLTAPPLVIEPSINEPSVIQSSAIEPIPTASQTPPLTPSLVPAPQVSPTLPPVPIAPPLPNVQTKYGHFPYAQAEARRLISVGDYHGRPESLDQDAATAFKKMIQVARSAQIKIIPISGFRTINEQIGLFARQIQRQGSPQAAAFLSAPAGYSEHHTGYAIDLADANAPQDDLRYSFEQTAAYKWLKQNASTYGFELSFPEKNSQGISFEPWHWRYIGSPRATAIFAAARVNRTSTH